MTALLAGLVDDAGLFPPSWLPMQDALARHRRWRHPVLSGRFLCPGDRVDELLSVLDGPIEVHVVGDDAVDLPTDPRITVRAVELRSGTRYDLPCYVEGVEPSVLAGKGVLGKLRCGGARIPPVDEVAHYVTECARVGLSFKGTAGMHAAVRGWESTNDQPHHGYLNVLLAVARALSGADVEGVLSCVDAESLASEAKSLDGELAGATRRLYHSYGSCDTERPVRDAELLGLA